jgi:hypothetical protein
VRMESLVESLLNRGNQRRNLRWRIDKTIQCRRIGGGGDFSSGLDCGAPPKFLNLADE